MARPGDDRRAARAWLRQQSRAGRRAARPVVLAGLLGTAMAIGQAFCAARILAVALAGGGVAVAPAVAFGILALLRALLGVASERVAFAAGAAARRRLRSDTLAALLQTGPALLRTLHSGDLAAIVVDRIEALDGLFARWIPAATLAIAAPALVAFAVAGADPPAAALLVLCGLAVPVAMALSGLGAAAAVAPAVRGDVAAAVALSRPGARGRNPRPARTRRG